MNEDDLFSINYHLINATCNNKSMMWLNILWALDGVQYSI